MATTNKNLKLDKVDTTVERSMADHYTAYNGNMDKLDTAVSAAQQNISSVEQNINLVYHGTSPKDLNSIVDRIALVYGGASDNAPVVNNGFWYVENIFYGAPSPTANHMQRATSYSSGASFVRVLSNGTWQAWRQMT